MAVTTDEVGLVQRQLLSRSRAFRRSLYIRHVDAGSDGSPESEILALSNPYYDLQRLGFFFTASPRHADILMVTGAVTTAMAEPLRATVLAMPEPCAVIAIGSSACGGGFEEGPETLGGVDAIVPVDVYVPGDPPSPLMILHGLLLAVGRVEQRLRRSLVASPVAVDTDHG
jgi:Ni,Fe-hydrogenase III small subunit